jgi:hypothetical protein
MQMGQTNVIAKVVSVATLGILATALLMMALAPNPSLYAG